VGRSGFSIQAGPRAFFRCPIRKQAYLFAYKVVFHLLYHFSSSHTFVSRIGAAFMTLFVLRFSQFIILVSPQTIEVRLAPMQCACRIVEPSDVARTWP
jgi:hypothetical protein